MSFLARKTVSRLVVTSRGSLATRLFKATVRRRRWRQASGRESRPKVEKEAVVVRRCTIPCLLEPRNGGETGRRRIQRSARRETRLRKVGGNRSRTSFSFDTGRSVQQFVIERFEPPFSFPRSSRTSVWEFYLSPRIAAKFLSFELVVSCLS